MNGLINFLFGFAVGVVLLVFVMVPGLDQEIERLELERDLYKSEALKYALELTICTEKL